jgi:hypothetical protein
MVQQHESARHPHCRVTGRCAPRLYGHDTKDVMQELNIDAQQQSLLANH